jgi:parallel beta-helix repeat protein
MPDKKFFASLRLCGEFIFCPFHFHPNVSILVQNFHAMKKLILFFLMMQGIVFSQSYIPISNNMIIGNNSNIKFIPNNYVFTDPGLDGVIQVNGVHDVILDGDSCTVNGTNYIGYMIKITNSHNIVIKNFDSVFKYKYAVYITGSDHIIINGNDFSRNKVDSLGWIDVWADYNSALGGGVMMYQCRAVQIFDNIMKYQNDGVAAYHCDSLKIHNNDFAWNTSYGIRMFWTDTCYIYENTASHINRPLTDPSDCAALLMIISNANRVENNDLSWSGDGVFLGQYQHSNIPNNNYFAYNQCSNSPHNAIEATFADGNIYKHNICNVSDYGMWLGYSFNSIVDSNEVNGNFHSGIAIDRGFNNVITHNTIKENPIGIQLWKGSPISGYQNQNSQDYFIRNNTIEGNTQGLSAITTTHAVIQNNQFSYNQLQSVYLEASSTLDTLSSNNFRMPVAYHIYNYSSDNIYAMNNSYEPNDTALINAKIYDYHDNASKGTVAWYPPLPGPGVKLQTEPPCDMAEPGAVWYEYPQSGYPGPRIADTVYFDSVEKVIGAASVRLVAGRGWDVALNYRPAGDSLSQWSLTQDDTLYFWVRTIKNVVIGFQGFHIRIGDAKGNYYKYLASVNLLNAANLNWIQYKFPLTGDNNFYRSMIGNMSLDDVNYVEFHADTWDYGYTLWVDGVQFTPCGVMTGIDPSPGKASGDLEIYPDPFEGSTNIIYSISDKANVSLKIFDPEGKEIRTLVHAMQAEGKYSVHFDASDLKPGIYFCNLISSKLNLVKKLILIR